MFLGWKVSESSDRVKCFTEAVFLDNFEFFPPFAKRETLPAKANENGRRGTESRR